MIKGELQPYLQSQRGRRPPVGNILVPPLRYESDLTDVEWTVIAPPMPRPASCGRPTLWTPREILNSIFYVLHGGIAWRLIAKELPLSSTTYGYFVRWRDEGVFRRINHHLVMAARERAGREASATAAVLGSQSVKTTESGGPRGDDTGKKVKGRKRQPLVHMDGRALVLVPQQANFATTVLPATDDSPGSIALRSGMAGVVSRERRRLVSTPNSYAVSRACTTSAHPQRIIRASALPLLSDETSFSPHRSLCGCLALRQRGLTLKILAVIMCGGSGTRVWPESRKSFPKQFIPLVGDLSAFQMGMEMLSQDVFETPIVVHNHVYRFLICEQLQAINRTARILLEPEGRDSGPAVAVLFGQLT